MGKMPIMEIFGPTIQGEGMVVGQKTMFIRTGGCDYSCSWCDSAFTWNGEQKAEMMTAKEVFARLLEVGDLNFNHVTISGGNPSLIEEPMMELIDLLHSGGINVVLETQGSIWKGWMRFIDDLTISPKPPSSEMKTDWLILDEIIKRLTKHRTNFTLKVVVFNNADFNYAKEVHKRYPNVGFYVSVGNKDSKETGDISERLLDSLHWLWKKVLSDPEANNFRPLPQLHTLVFANRRGV